MPEPDLTAIRDAVRLRDRCRQAAVENGRRLGIPLSGPQANVAYDAMAHLIRDAAAATPEPIPAIPAGYALTDRQARTINTLLAAARAWRATSDGRTSRTGAHAADALAAAIDATTEEPTDA